MKYLLLPLPWIAEGVVMASDGRPLVLWDGTCAVCQRAAGWAARKDTRARLRLTPFQQVLLPEEARLACTRAVHVVTDDGEVLTGGRASLFIMGRLGWPRLARLLALPPLVWAVELGYRVAARHRSSLARWL